MKWNSTVCCEHCSSNCQLCDYRRESSPSAHRDIFGVIRDEVWVDCSATCFYFSALSSSGFTEALLCFSRTSLSPATASAQPIVPGSQILTVFKKNLLCLHLHLNIPANHITGSNFIERDFKMQFMYTFILEAWFSLQSFQGRETCLLL